MKLIVGLGNPGVEYAQSRHNIGFLLIDLMAHELKLEFRPRFQGLCTDTVIAGEKVFLLKPQTYMNLSGHSVRELTQFYKIPPQDIIVAHDDMDLPLGKTRLRTQGSSGGHNGIRSIIGELGTDQFWRLKMGVGRPPQGFDPARYVLSPFKEEEIPVLENVLDRALQAVKLWAQGEGNRAMNLYNR